LHTRTIQEAGSIRVAKTIELDESTEQEFRVLVKRRTVEARLQQRALVVLLAADGRQNKDIAVEAGLDRRQVALWREHLLAGEIDALRKDAPRSGRPATITAETESRIVQATLHDGPINATHWSTRTRGRTPRRGCDDHPSRLAEQRPEAAPESVLQAFAGSAL
jgi:hypothetical protein